MVIYDADTSQSLHQRMSNGILNDQVCTGWPALTSSATSHYVFSILPMNMKDLFCEST